MKVPSTVLQRIQLRQGGEATAAIRVDRQRQRLGDRGLTSHHRAQYEGILAALEESDIAINTTVLDDCNCWIRRPHDWVEKKQSKNKTHVYKLRISYTMLLNCFNLKVMYL